MARGPSHFKELEDMLKTFRCQDLANLLAYANHPKNGKKTELLERCIKLLEKGSVPIQIKIKEIYNSKNSLQSNGDLISSPELAPSCLMNNNNNQVFNSTNMVSSTTTSNNELFGVSNSSSSNVAVGGSTGQQQRQNYFNGNKNNTPSAFNSNTTTSTASISIPQQHQLFNNGGFNKNEIKFKKLAFYEVTSEIVKPIILQPNNLNNRPYTFSFQFQLQCNHADEISVSRHISDGKFEYTTQLQLRFALIENSAEQVDNFPPNTNVNVNSKPAQLPPPKPTSKPNADMIRPGRAVDITGVCRLAPNMSNKVEITWTNPDSTKVYCVSVFIVKKLTTQTLMDRLKNNFKKSIDFTKQLVKEKLAITDNDLEIETSTLKASLLCPLMKCRIKIPGRSTLCKHVQCFDLFSYLSMNEKKPTWNCPVCDRHAPYEELMIDSYFEEILQKCSDCEEIQFLPSGDWSKIDSKKKDSKSKSIPANHVNIAESPLKEIVKPTSQIKIAQSQLNTTTNSHSLNPPPSKIICVDLTIDSDDDDDNDKINPSTNYNKNNETNLIRTTTTTTTPASPTASIISLSSGSSTPPSHHKECNSSTSSRSHSPNNLVINTDDNQESNIIKNLINTNQPPPSSSPQQQQQQLRLTSTSKLRNKSPEQPTTVNNNPQILLNDIKRSSSTISQIITNKNNKNEIFDINNRKTSTSSSSGSTNQGGGGGIMNQTTFDDSISPVHSPLSPNIRQTVGSNDHGLLKSSIPNMKDKAAKLMDEIHSNQPNTNYFLKDPTKIHKSQNLASLSTSYNNLINGQQQQQQQQQNNKNYQITSSDNLKIRLTNNNSNNYPLNDHHYQQQQQQQQNNYNTLFPSIPAVNGQLTNVMNNKPQQPQLLNQQFHQNHRSYNNFNGGSGGQRTNNNNNNLYSTKNSTIYQNSRSSNNIREPNITTTTTSGGGGGGYDANFRFNQQYQHHLQQPFQMHPFQQQSTQLSAQNNNLFQNNSNNSSRHHSLAQSPPAHSHS